MSDHANDKLVALKLRRPHAHAHGDGPAHDHRHGDDPAHDHGHDEDHDDEADAPTRRDFLSLVGFGATAATLAACRAPEQRAVPLPVAAEELVAGVANHYATTCGGCAAACSLVVKQRDGRPIKIEGNEASPLFGGATCATGQATVLSLYDEERLRGPLLHGKPAAWAEIDARVRAALGEPGAIAIVTDTLTSPTTHAVLARWRAAFPGMRHVVYDPVSASGLRAATQRATGRPGIPHYAFDRAQVIVALDADFLGTWLSPVEFARQYARRAADALHIHFEPGLSITGSNADRRIAVAPSQLAAVARALLARVLRRAGDADVPASPDPIGAAALDRVADELWQHRGAALVVAGGNDEALQLAALALNHALGNVGITVDLDRPSLQRQGDDDELARLVHDMQRGAIRVAILHGINPAYDLGATFVQALARVPLAISTADRLDETARLVHAVCPDHHFLEAWGDAEPVVGHLSLRQPTIAPLYDTRSFVDSLLRWLGDPADHYTALRAHWRTQIMPRQPAIAAFDAFWDASLERGVVDVGGGDPVALHIDGHAALAALRDEPATGDYELAVFESVALRDGRHANNPWLLELPDPITKVAWGNVAAIAPGVADQLGLRNGDVVALRTATGNVEVPVFRQPGQHPRAISLALGHGRTHAGKAGDGVGVNAFPLVGRRTWIGHATLAATGHHEDLAATQTHFSMEGRPIVLETTRAELDKPPQREELPDLWTERAQGAHAWGMAIDLDTCTGCSACVIACQAENNVPVVGKDQIQRERNMHWIRIDRYYTGADDHPQSLHQPMMCQHCGHAPCETVCPVLATTTSAEGLNQQVYNRCIGTRYCANNCPYKVRRFNWYNYTTGNHAEYHMANPVGRLVLNPDVTVRSRGVMEKCSLCVQRIHAAKNAAVKRDAPLRDGDIQTACQQVCPSDAIRFGDLNDPTSQVAQRARGPRAYKLLDELGTRPNVSYLKKVRHGQAT